MLNVAKAHTQGAAEAPANPLDQAQQIADINETNATAAHKRAAAAKIYHGAAYQPLQDMADHVQQVANRQTDSLHRDADRMVDHFHRSADRAMEHGHRNADRIQEAINQQQAAQQPMTGES